MNQGKFGLWAFYLQSEGIAIDCFIHPSFLGHSFGHAPWRETECNGFSFKTFCCLATHKCDMMKDSSQNSATQNLRWPELLAAFLQMIWCASISGEGVGGRIVVEERLLLNPDVVCWSGDHFASLLIAIIGLSLWCVLVPLTLFWQIYRLRDRQSAENLRKYGYFCEGYEPRYWWWDILVKRIDIGFMNIVTYTSIASDGKAKLLLFPFVSGCMLAIASWYQPFANTQAEILDFLEMCLLSFRFFMFSTIAVLLIFNPAAESMWAIACILAFLLATFCTYFGLHVLVQFLRSSVKVDDSDESDAEVSQLLGKEKGRKKGMKKLAGMVLESFHLHHIAYIATVVEQTSLLPSQLLPVLKVHVLPQHRHSFPSNL